jgi:hypothetical protein
MQWNQEASQPTLCPQNIFKKQNDTLFSDRMLAILVVVNLGKGKY